MAKISVTYRSGRVGKNGTAPVLIAVMHVCNGKYSVAYMPTGVAIEPQYWNDANEGNQWVKGHKMSRSFNATIEAMYVRCQSRLMSLISTNGCKKMDAKSIKSYLMAGDTDDVKEEEPSTFARVYYIYMDGMKDSTRKIYERTLKELEEFDGRFEQRLFEDIDVDYLSRFNKYLSKGGRNKTNTCAIYMRNIRSVFNYAINERLTDYYPFRWYKIKTEQTDELPITTEQLREIWHAPLESWQEEWVDLAKLVFLLIGINMVDLSKLTHVDKDGYIRYTRTKTDRQDSATNPRKYCIKVEPEAMAIIERWRGENHLLACFDRNVSYKSVNVRMVHAVKCIGLPPAEKGGQGNKAEVSRHSKAKVTENSKYGDFSLYSLRRGWATIAFNECDISMEDISLALGHSDGMGLSVTQRYVRASQKKIDAANRKVIDYVLEINR